MGKSLMRFRRNPRRRTVLNAGHIQHLETYVRVDAETLIRDVWQFRE